MIKMVDEESGRWSKPYAAATALELQDACNLGGVTRAMHEIFRAYLLDGTGKANQSAPMKLAMHQAAWLATGQLLLSDTDYSAAHRECEALAGAEWTQKTSK